MRSRWVLAAVAVVVSSVVLPAGAAQAGEVAPTRHLVSCEYIPTPDKPAAKPVSRPFPLAWNRGTKRATIWTNYGRIVLELDRGNAPCAVHNFVHLARQRFYHRTQCFRLTDSARLGVLQCGDIYAVEEGGPGYRFADEVTGKETYPRGTVAMGNQGPGTNGSQFFVVHSHANIPPAYSVLGRVVRGMHVLDAIVAAGIEDGKEDGLPAEPVRIHRVWS